MPTTLKPGDTFERYMIEEVLGEGGMGCVYRAHDSRLDRKVALKVLHINESDDAHETAKTRLLREARAAAALNSPHVVHIYDVGEVEGSPYIAMELVAGKTLRCLVGDGSIPLEERVRILLDVAQALEASHVAKLVHRDVKPENVMVRTDGRVVVLDFGIARRGSLDADGASAGIVPTLTAPGVRIGTPHYMAPEQIKGDVVDGRADQFAWAAMAYELLAGKPPWKGKDALGIVASILSEEPTPLAEINPQVDEHLDAVVMRALSKSPSERFSSMQQISDALKISPSGLPKEAPRVPVSNAAPKKPTERSAKAASEQQPTYTTDLRRYSTEEMREILDRALARSAEETSKSYSKRDILEAAREAGIDEEAVRGATRALVIADPDQERLRSKRKLQRHVAIWAVFSLFFFMLDLLTAGLQWFYFPMLGWGVGVAVHAIKYMFPVEPSPRQHRRLERRRKRLRERLEATEQELEEAVDYLLTTTEQRIRIDPVPRVRVSDQRSMDEAERELEAELENEAKRSRKQKRNEV